MSGLSALLSIDTASLDAKISVAGNSSNVSLSISISDPLGLLGDTGALIRSVGDIVDSGADLPALVREAFGALAEIAPFADLTMITEVVETLAKLKARLDPLVDMMGLDPAAMVAKALGPGGPGAVIDQIVTQVTDTIAAEIPEAIAAPLGALQDLGAGVPGSAAEVAGFFARFVIGLDLDAISAPFGLLDSVRAQIAGGAEIALLEGRITSLTASIDLVAEGLVSADPDMAALLATLAQIRAEIDLLTTTVLPQAIDALTADIGSVDVAGLAAQLDDALAPLLARAPVPTRGLGDLFLPPLRMLHEGLDEFEPQLLKEVLAELEADVRGIFAQSGISTLGEDASNLLSGIVGFLKGLPLPELRDQLTQALLGIEGKLGVIGDFSPVADIAEKMQEVADAIDGIDTSAITDQIQALADEVRGFADNFPIEEIKDDLGALLGVANDLVAELPPLIDELKAQIDLLADGLTAIDLSAARDASVSVVHDLRTKVKKALDSADLPDALKTPLGMIAGEVRKIDLTASLDAPLSDLVAKIDIAAALAPVQGAIAQARAALMNLSPTAVVKQLDAPFEAMLDKLAEVSPTALTNKLSQCFIDAADQLDKVSPTALVQPLQDEFDAILAKAREAADPKPLLAPLAVAYTELLSILDLIDPAKLIGKLIGEVSKLPGAMADASAGSIGAKVNPATALPPIGPAGIFHFGDLVRPFAMLVNEAREAVLDGAEDVLEEGLAIVSRPLAMLSHAGQVAGSHLNDIADAIERRRRLVDPNAHDGPLADMRRALVRLSRIEAALAAGGRGSVELGGAVGSVQLDVYATVTLPKCQGLDTVTAGLTSGLQTDELSRSLHALGNVLSSFVPPALALPDTEATILARINALFDAIDPTPVADEMDAIGDALQAKLQSFAGEIVGELFRIWAAVFEEMTPVLPQGLLPVLGEVMDAIREQLAVLDPARLEAELDELLDAVISQLQAYSPAAFAGTLTSSFEALKAKLLELDPGAMLGNLDPITMVIDDLRELKPSEVLKPLTTQAEQVDKALAALFDFNPAEIIIEAIANLKLQVELVLEGIEEELDGLLGDLEGAGGGEGSVSVSVSVTV